MPCYLRGIFISAHIPDLPCPEMLDPPFRKAMMYSIRSVRDFIYDVRLKF
ncbi:hypothetical protein SAMN05216327_103320 [Dyadobacter sp. SG02]|nr:hypothetical protein SAMN05216327_103320 [Dyadobacter sp. SG02]